MRKNATPMPRSPMTRNLHLAAAVLGALSLSGSAFAQATAPAPVNKPATGGAPPAYTPLRWNEDYSYLKDPARRTDPFDPIKYIPLSGDGDIWLSLGGQYRYRYELFSGVNFNG